MFKRYFIVLAIALNIFFMTFCNSAVAADLKIAHVNMRQVFFEYEKTKQANKELEKEDQAVKKEIDQRAQTLRKLKDEIDLLSEEAKKKREPELQEKLREFDEFRRSKIEEFVQKKEDLFTEIKNDILRVIENYSKKNGYDIVFDKAMLIYSSDKFEITETIIAELNK